MDASYIISCCSTADLTDEQLKEKNIEYICMHFSLDGEAYRDDLGKSVSYDDFYNAMHKGAETKTSQISVGEFTEYFTPFLEQGKDILHISLSSGLSGTYNSALIAKEHLEEQFSDRKIYILDSLSGSSGYGMIVERLADLRAEGKSIDECKAWADEHTLEQIPWFFVSDLKWLIKGGRISKTAGVLGSFLQICPLITADKKGTLVPKHKIRTKKKAMAALVDKMEEVADNGLAYDAECYVCHAGCPEEGKTVASMIEERFVNLAGKIKLNRIGTTMGSHCGPGTVAIFFWGKKRTE